MSRLIRGGTRIPSPARAAGYLTNTFSSDVSVNQGFTTSTVDMSRTYASGFQWYYWKFFGESTPNASVLNGDGTISVSSGPGNANICSCGSISGNPNYVGTAFGGGAYFDAEISLNPVGANTGTIWPAWWGMALEHLAPILANGYQWSGQASNYFHFIETDFFELIPPPIGSTFNYDATLHDWYGQFGITCPPGFCETSSNSSVATANQVQVPTNFNWNLPHHVSMLWIPATDSSNGSITFYLDEVAVIGPILYSQFTTQSPPPTTSTPWTFGVIDQQHIALILGGGGNPLNVNAVNVWQLNDSNNLHN
jgi:hypothetical protein